MKQVFEGIKVIKSDEPMVETDFYKWLAQVKPNRFIEAIKGFYPDFIVGYHFLTEEQVKNHKSVYEHFWFLQHNKGWK